MDKTIEITRIKTQIVVKIKTVINHWNTLWELFRSTSKAITRINNHSLYSRIISKIVTSSHIYIYIFCLIIYH